MLASWQSHRFTQSPYRGCPNMQAVRNRHPPIQLSITLAATARLRRGPFTHR